MSSRFALSCCQIATKNFPMGLIPLLGMVLFTPSVKQHESSEVVDF